MPWGGSSWGGSSWGGGGSKAQGGRLLLDVQLKGRIKGPEPLPIGDLDLLTIYFVGKLKARPAVLAGQLAIPLGVGDDLFAPMKVSNIPIFTAKRFRETTFNYDRRTVGLFQSSHVARSIGESRGLAEGATRSTNSGRSPADTRTTSDAAAKTAHAGRGTSDSTTTTDTSS